MIPDCVIGAILEADDRRAALVRTANRIDALLRAAGADEDEIRRFIAALCERVSEAQQ